MTAVDARHEMRQTAGCGAHREVRPHVKTHLSRRDLALTLVVVTIWGYAFVPIKVALTEVPPFTLAAVRFFLAAVPMVFFVRPPAMPWRNVVAYGFAIGVCQFGLLFLGLELGMPAGLSSLVIQVQVFFTIGLAVVYAGDGLRRHNLIGGAIAVVGIAVLAAYKLASGLTGTFVGFALVIAAAFAWATGNLIAKRAARDHAADMFALTVWSSLVPPLPLAVRIRLVERAAASGSDGAHLAFRLADPRRGNRERRAVPRRGARTSAGRGRRAGLRGPRRQRLRTQNPRASGAAALIQAAANAAFHRCHMPYQHRNDHRSPA